MTNSGFDDSGKPTLTQFFNKDGSTSMEMHITGKDSDGFSSGYSDQYFPGTQNLSEHCEFSHGMTTSKLSVNPETGEVAIESYDAEGNVTGTQNFKSMEDYKAFQEAEKQMKSIQDRNTEKAFKNFES